MIDRRLVVAAVMALAGCAPSPETIQPVKASEVPYRPWTCEQLAEEDGRLSNELRQAYVKQSKTRSDDAVGIALTFFPLASMEGRDLAPQIAVYKGQQDAVRAASEKNGCPALPPKVVAAAAR